MKVCRDCGAQKPVGAFYASADCAGGVRPSCRACENAKRTERYAANKVAIQAQRRERYHANGEEMRRKKRDDYYSRDPSCRALNQTLKRYDLTLDQYHAMHERQDFCCAICGDPLTSGKHGTHVDHSHTTGRVRGLLCNGCNLGIGHFRERSSALAAAAHYVAA